MISVYLLLDFLILDSQISNLDSLLQTSILDSRILVHIRLSLLAEIFGLHRFFQNVHG